MSINTGNSAPYSQFVENGKEQREESESPPVPSNLIPDSQFIEHIYYYDPTNKTCCYCKYDRFKWCNIHWKCCWWKCRLSVCMAAFFIFLLLALSFLLTVAYLGGYIFQSIPSKPACCDDSSDCASFNYDDWQHVLTHIVKKQDDKFQTSLVEYIEFFDESISARFQYFIGNISAFNVSSLDCSSQFAFYINVYNAFAIKLILEHTQKNGDFVDSITDISEYWGLRSVWKMTAGKIDGVDYTLDNIEHDTLRKYWSDPRMHACIVWASVSCPDLRREAAYQPVLHTKTLEQQLNTSMIRFVNNTAKGVKVDGDTLWLNTIFGWYQSDFQPDVKQVIAEYIADSERKADVLNTNHIEYFDYDWNLNSV